MRESHDMIGYQWTVYHKQSTCESDDILATDITDKPEKAKAFVETTLAEGDHMAWGLLLRIALDPWSSFRRSSQTANWPATGEIQVCQRGSGGGFSWGPFCPCHGARVQPIPNLET